VLYWRMRIPFNQVDNPRNYLTKVMRYETPARRAQFTFALDEFVRAAWQCWNSGAVRTYNVTNPGSVTPARSLN